MEISIVFKNDEILIPDENGDPFGNDKLNRKTTIRYLTSIVEKISQSFVISIEAPWGCGKTTFLRLWEYSLPPEFYTVRFNAWKTDYFEDPLLAFISEISKQLRSHVTGFDEIFEKLKTTGLEVARISIPIIMELLTKQIINETRLAALHEAISQDQVTVLVNGLSNYAKEKFEELNKKEQDIEKFKSSLSELINKLHKNNVNKYPLLIFVDELDRCRPDYALKLLERINHLFNIENVIFILAIDRSQLSGIVKSVYGTQDADEYLRKFIDLSYRIPEPSRKSFCNMLFGKYGLDKLSNIRGLRPAHISTRFSELADYYQLSLRAIEQCYITINIIAQSAAEVDPELFYFLLALKTKCPEIYERIKRKKIEIEMPTDDQYDPNAATPEEQNRTLLDISKIPEDGKINLSNFFPQVTTKSVIKRNEIIRISTFLWFYTSPEKTINSMKNSLDDRYQSELETNNPFIMAWGEIGIRIGMQGISKHFDILDIAADFYL
jgi:hypothetical protein